MASELLFGGVSWCVCLPGTHPWRAALGVCPLNKLLLRATGYYLFLARCWEQAIGGGFFVVGGFVGLHHVGGQLVLETWVSALQSKRVTFGVLPLG